MAADLFETYAVTVVATMLLAAIFFAGADVEAMMGLPLVIGAVCILASVVGTFFVRLGSNMKIMQALYKGFIASAVLSAVLIGGAIVRPGDAVVVDPDGVVVLRPDADVCAALGL